jgi:RNA polymerase sigma-70 factor (ECF subfamily)
MTASAGARSLQPYISLAMNHHQAGKKEDEQRHPPVYFDRTAHSLEVQLVSLASAGDDSAFPALVTRYHAAVFRWALAFAWDPDEAEDIAQEVFVRAHRQLSNYRSDGSLEAWLYAITRTAAGQARRTHKRRKRLALSPAAQPLRDVYTTDPGGRVDRERAAGVILELFAELPQRQREIFDLVDLQGLSPAEAADRTGMKAVSVRASLFKARKTIRARILASHPSYRELDK